MLKVVIIDDESIVREGLMSIIDWEKVGYKIIGEGRDGTDGLNKILSLKPDLVLIDIKMPGINGIQVIQSAKAKGYRGKVILLTGYCDFKYAQNAIKLGVSAYLVKPIDEDELIRELNTIYKEINKNIPMSYKQAQSIINRKFYYEEAKIVDCESIEASRDNRSYITVYSEKIYTALEIGDLEGLHEIFKKIEVLSKQSSISPEILKGLSLNFLTTIKEKYNEGEAFTIDKEALISSIYKKNTLHELVVFIEEECIEVCKGVNNNSSKNIIGKILNYIDKNYYKNLKLESLAKVFNYNSAYLGKIFKNCTNNHFNDYINIVRIEKAKELLIGGNLKVCDISEKVGYKNIDYFYIKFKKYVGLSPKEYKNKNMQKESIQIEREVF